MTAYFHHELEVFMNSARVAVLAEEIGGIEEAIDAQGDLRTLPHQLRFETSRLSGWAGFYASRLIRL